MTTFPTALFVHGAWHGGWSWAPLQAQLDKRGIASIAVDLPGHGASTLEFTDMHGDARHVAEVAQRIGGNIILVGHSYGGGVIGEAATQIMNANSDQSVTVSHLVYMAAFVLDVGESVGGLAASLPKEPNLLNPAIISGADGNLTLDAAKAIPALYNTSSKKMARAAVARLSPQPAVTFGQPCTGAPWKLLPSTYVVCEKDQAVHPNHQRIMAERCTNVVSLDCDHSPFMCMPKESAKILKKIVKKSEQPSDS